MMAFVLCLFFAGQANARMFNLQQVASSSVNVVRAATISDDEIIDYVSEAVYYMDKANRVLPASNPYSVRLKKLTSGILSVNGVPLNFRVYDIKGEVNAFACADGSIRVTTQLMDLMNDDELLAVIGHEIGHIGKSHCIKAIKKGLLSGALHDFIGTYDRRIGSQQASRLVGLSEFIIVSKYSRKQELAADDFGYEFMIRQNKDPRDMVSALKKLYQIEPESTILSRLFAKVFSTHPLTQSRIAHIEERCEADGYPILNSIDRPKRLPRR